ncbi:MAG TPA: hydroxymethylglutaryl-CoA synthase [Methanotrichaceae archaeon]|nr:hydroxymethylglutaryl-CoA synthase [Methanotrichaceae archaeon]HQF16659.1 hydroxymethylglutaryl-CoA synthase [Methanotrichaceae archaeon]HQI91329.1 hydroxymethylglutaryl-CoA synthase [Methanotrichaceae archaeon]HQJ28743.1 hydroxymethylglutaryl-CoA synthase [Methanotrichaceae archaeon]
MSQPPNDVGIDDVAVHFPRLYLSTTGQFAAARGLEPAKLVRGIGVEQMAVPDRHEDAATMAANALLELMQRNRLGPGDIGRIYIGTESSVDEAKAMGTYVIGMLERIYGRGSFSECSTVELKSACIAASYALENVSLWAGNKEGNIGVVIATDIARYSLNSPGEYTQGAGAVALLVKRQPRMISLDQEAGFFTRDENDFFRPLGMKTAVVNGKHSNQCYLDAVEGAFASYCRSARGGPICPPHGSAVTDAFDHILMHIPYPRMVEYAAASLFCQEWQGLDRWNSVEAQIGPLPRPGDFPGPAEYQEASSQYQRRFARTPEFIRAFSAKVEPSTLLSRRIGNIYTGSLYLGLASLAESGHLLAGQRCAFLSYGSGCSAMVFSGRVSRQIGDVPLRGLLKRLQERSELSLTDYELLHEGARSESAIPPSGEFALLGEDEQGYRHYDWAK